MHRNWIEQISWQEINMQDLCSKHITMLIINLIALVVPYHCEYGGQQDNLNTTVVKCSITWMKRGKVVIN